MRRAHVVGQELRAEPGDDPGRRAQLVVGQRRHDELVGPDVGILLLAETAIGGQAQVVEQVALEAGRAVHHVGVGLRAGPPQQLQPGQDVEDEVVVVLAPPRREDADGARGRPRPPAGGSAGRPGVATAWPLRSRARGRTGACRPPSSPPRTASSTRPCARWPRRSARCARGGVPRIAGGRPGAPPEAVDADPSAATTSTTSTPPSGWSRVVRARSRRGMARRRRRRADGGSAGSAPAWRAARPS